MEGAFKGKKFNNRKFPGIYGRRPDKKAYRVEVATANAERWAAMSTAQKIKDLDRRLGTGKGAVKQRAKLAKLDVASNEKSKQK